MNSPTIREIVPKVYCLTYDTRYNLCMSFVRIQEFYESQRFKGKYFTLEDFMDYWSLEFGNGSFDYPSRWSGFNFPGKVLDNWISLFTVSNLRDKENILVNKILRKSKFDLKDIYVIGTHKDNKTKERNDIIEHELAHAMYCIYPKYKQSCDKLISTLKSTKWGMVKYVQTAGRLKDMGYCDDVIDDEIQAYWSTGNSKDSLLKFASSAVDTDTDITALDFVNNFNKFKKRVKNK